MLTAHGATHPGRVRKINEDSWFCDTDLGVFVVADGMGGHSAGEVASKLAVEAVQGFLVRSRDGEDCTWPYGIDPKLSLNGNRLMTSLKLANRRVFKAGENRDEYTGMGTTTVAVLIDRNRLTYAGVGDSRIYSFVEGRLQQLTTDDSWISEVLARDPGIDKTALLHHPMRNVLTKVIGACAAIEVPVTERPLRDGELLLLCSDGLHGFVDFKTIEGILASGSSINVIAEQLVQATLQGAASDNITALVVRYDS
jgi:serine/threonine protein phosphatase PrpC